MDQSTEHVREVSNTLYKYHLDNFLCDVFIVMPDGSEIQAHSVVLSAVSVKLRGAFEKSDNALKKNYAFRLFMPDCDVTTVEMVLQFVYTGTIAFQNDSPIDITKTLSAGQRLGLDANKLASFLGALLSLADASVMENLPPVILTDEDICLEIIERGKPHDKFDNSRSSSSCLLLPKPNPEASVEPEYHLMTSLDNDTDTILTSTNSKPIDSTETPCNVIKVDLSAVKENLSSCDDDSVDECYSVDLKQTESMSADHLIDSKQCWCKKCGQALSTATLSSHSCPVAQGANHSERISNCSLCGQLLANDQERATHNRIVHPSRIECPVCQKTFVSERGMFSHKSSQHDGMEVAKMFSCDICHHAFVRANLLAVHYRTHSGIRPFQCEVCGRRFICRGDLNKHHRLHVNGYLYKCSICGKEIKTSRESSDHRRMHYGGIVCPICGKTFTRTLNMQAHVRGTHEGERRFRCTECGKTFVYAQNLRHHRRQHQVPRPHTCTTCQCGFNTADDLAKHVARKHANNDKGATPNGEQEAQYELYYVLEPESVGNEAESELVDVDVVQV